MQLNTSGYKLILSNSIRDLDTYICFQTGGNLDAQFSDYYPECHNSFPGWGGGAGVNRFARKFGCFVEGTGGYND